MKRRVTLSRLVSILLLLGLVLGLAPTLTDQPADAYNASNAQVATEEQLATFEDTFSLNENGGGLRIINGALYVWGSNSAYALGMYTKSETGGKTPVPAGTVYPSPVRHPINDELEDGDRFAKVQGANAASFALTEQGRLYYWGSGTSYYGETSLVPKEIYTDIVKGNNDRIVTFHGGNVGLVAVGESGQLYFAGSYMGYTDYDDYDSSVKVKYRLFPMSDAFEDTLQDAYDPNPDLDEAARQTALEAAGQQVGGANRRKVYKAFNCGWYYSSLIITQTHGVPDAVFTPGDNHTFGGVSEMSQSKPLHNIEDLDLYPGNAEMVANGINYASAVGCTHSSALIDNAGNVWVCGGAFTAISDVDTPPMKIFDAGEKTVRAVKVWVTQSILMVLGQDNSVWAFGRNAYQFIDPNQEAGAMVFETNTPIFQSISATQTITGCHISNTGVMVITKSGDIYWNGDNTSGTAGNGSTENPEGGGIVSANPPNIDPLEPVTKNEISFEIELEGDGTRYRLGPNGQVQRSVKSNGVYQAYTGMTDVIKIKAGTQFLLNVYFEDFAKLTGFTVPIRFDPKYLEVVNDNGAAYPKNIESTPGAINGTTGIHETFGNNWSGGYLVGEAGEQGTYPKVCNTGGWVSISGHTLNQKAGIEGKVKMFTVRFNVREKTDAGRVTTFILADGTSANTGFFGAPASTNGSYNLYDDSATGTNNGACFSIPSSKDDGLPGVFDLHSPENGLCPNFITELILAQQISVTLQKSDSGPVASSTVKLNNADYTAPALPNANASETYSVISKLSRTDNGGEPSFQNVNWSFEVLAYNEAPLGSALPISDYTDYHSYLTVVDEGLKTLKFRVKSDLPEKQAAVIKITATSAQLQENNKALTTSITVVLKDMEAPKSLQIVEKPNYADYTVIYTSTDTHDLPVGATKFTASFPDDAAITNANANMAVTWRLMDKDGNEIPTADNTAAAFLENPTLASGTPGMESYVAPSVTVRPCHTTPGNEYLILRVESAYNSSVYDEMYIKVHLNATELKFKQELLRMPVDSSRDLSSLLLIAPENDYYAVDLNWEWLGVEAGLDHQGKMTYLKDAAYTRVSADGMLTSLSDPSVSETAQLTEAYRVTDSYSGKTAVIRVQTLQLTTPINANNVTVRNVVGDLADEIVVTGLEQGDIITFYQDYSRDFDLHYTFEGGKVNEAFTQAKKEGKIQQFTVTAAQAAQPSVTFSVQHFLSGQGGEIGVTVYGEKTINGVTFAKQEFDKVPVSYDAEPSKVYGYISLAGKASGERLAGIAIQLTGLSNPDVVYTDVNGYFEFKTYIRPGNYSMNIYQDNYLRRIIKPDSSTGYAGITIPSAAEFAISTKSDPIVLYPGDLNGDGAINATDINRYLRSWFGKSANDVTSEQFSHYDFYDGAYEVIDLIDLDYVARHNGWTRESYPNWNIPTVK